MRRIALALGLVALAAGCGGAKHAAVPEIALLTGVHAGGDSVRFEFRSAPQHVTVRYLAPSKVAEAGSGKAVAIGAPTAAVVHFTPAASADVEGEQVVLTYTGPKRLAGSGPVRDVVKISDFEADLGWAVGLDRRLPYRVSQDGATVTVTFG